MSQFSKILMIKRTLINKQITIDKIHMKKIIEKILFQDIKSLQTPSKIIKDKLNSGKFQHQPITISLKSIKIL